MTYEDEEFWDPDRHEDAAERVLQYRTVEEFVVDYLAPHIRRRLGGQATWCAQWWRHEEALSRLTAIWSAWEHLRYEGSLGLSTWWLHHADPHLAVLLAKDNGPFAACKPDRHIELDPLPCEPAPEGTWAAAAYSDPEAAVTKVADSPTRMLQLAL